MPTDIGPKSDNKVLNSIMSSSCSTSNNTCSINLHSSIHLIHSKDSLNTVNMAHVTYQYYQAISDSIGSLIDGDVHGGLAHDVHMLNYTE